MDLLCEELGGPAEIPGWKIRKTDFERVCEKYPWSKVEPSLKTFQADVNIVRKHWPWAAFAIDQYNFQTEQQAKYSDELAPKEVVKLLAEIEKSAKNLRSGLCQLEKLSNRLRDPTAPNRRGHLAWLDTFIAQAIAGRPSNDVNLSEEHLLMIQSAKWDFLKRLAGVQGGAKVAARRVDRDSLERERGQSNPAFLPFVFRCGKVWKSLTGCEPAANKVASKGRSEDPHFVIFVQGLAKIGGAPEPTRNQVETCLKAITGKNSW